MTPEPPIEHPEHPCGASEPTSPDLREALQAILGEAEEVIEAQHGSPIGALEAIARRARAALAQPEPLDVEPTLSRGPREVLTAALLRGPVRYSRSGSQALAERLLMALEDAGYVIGEVRP